MKNWLCIGDVKKNIPKCLHSEVSINEWTDDYGRKRTHLCIRCGITLRMVEVFKTQCDYYNNMTLMESIKKNDGN